MRGYCEAPSHFLLCPGLPCGMGMSPLVWPMLNRLLSAWVVGGVCFASRLTSKPMGNAVRCDADRSALQVAMECTALADEVHCVFERSAVRHEVRGGADG